jgi:hypothetical protein
MHLWLSSCVLQDSSSSPPSYDTLKSEKSLSSQVPHRPVQLSPTFCPSPVSSCVGSSYALSTGWDLQLHWHTKRAEPVLCSVACLQFLKRLATGTYWLQSSLNFVTKKLYVRFMRGDNIMAINIGLRMLAFWTVTLVWSCRYRCQRFEKIQSRRWKQYVPEKGYVPTSPQGVTMQKININLLLSVFESCRIF